VQRFDFVVIGGGIVGASTAWQLQQQYPDATILLLEKEAALARHQTGRNSGVIHAGVYYQPGSLKADFCRRGAQATIAFCKTHGLPYEQCGKLLVATDEREVKRMAALEQRCALNGIETRPLSRSELRRREPLITGLGAIYVPATGITDYRRITAKMAAEFVALGGKVRTGRAVTALRESGRCLHIQCGSDRLEAGYMVVCGGLMADRLARMMGIAIDFQILPFRGEYYRLKDRHHPMVRHLIYPIPDPELPFLGVHLTRMIDGSVTVGPNAVLGWKREGYGRINLNIEDALEMLRFSGFWNVLKANWAAGLVEFRDSMLPNGYLQRIRKYCPSLTLGDFLPHPVGIRAQAVRKDGEMVHDFLFAASERSLHVCNAPSPAATSAIPIGAHLCTKVAASLG
jgi:L-2-hydroxyglutarate oxidase